MCLKVCPTDVKQDKEDDMEEEGVHTWQRARAESGMSKGVSN